MVNAKLASRHIPLRLNKSYSERRPDKEGKQHAKSTELAQLDRARELDRSADCRGGGAEKLPPWGIRHRNQDRADHAIQRSCFGPQCGGPRACGLPESDQ